jgi:hypothetical protein
MEATFLNVETFDFTDYNADTQTVTIRLRGPVLRLAHLEPLRRSLAETIQRGNRVSHVRIEPGEPV